MIVKIYWVLCDRRTCLQDNDIKDASRLGYCILG